MFDAFGQMSYCNHGKEILFLSAFLPEKFGHVKYCL